jgi:hypothetical protein
LAGWSRSSRARFSAVAATAFRRRRAPFAKAFASNSAPSPASRTDASPVAAVAALLAKRWAREDFEAYAVAHQFL